MNEKIDIWWGNNQHILSNLAKRPFVDKNNRFYYCVEHAYQSWKSGLFDKETYNKYTSHGTKHTSRLKPKTASNWNVQLMKKLIRLSLQQNPEALKYLLETKDAVLTHNKDRGIWKKSFPKVLMQLRDEFNRKLIQADDFGNYFVPD